MLTINHTIWSIVNKIICLFILSFKAMKQGGNWLINFYHFDVLPVVRKYSVCLDNNFQYDLNIYFD